MTGHTVLSQDERLIESIIFNPGEDGGLWYEVGKYNVTKIEAYDESGEMSFIPWIAVYMGDVIVARTPADKVLVVYHIEGAENEIR